MSLTEHAQEWLETRGIDVELAVRLGVDSVERGGGEWIKIPYVQCGEVVNHKYRCVTEKRHGQDKGATKCFWNYDVITDESLADQPLMIFEGEFDAMIAIQCGYPRSISVPDGAPSAEMGEEDTGAKYSYWTDAQKDFRACREIVLASDQDEPGKALFNDLAVRIGKARVKHVRYPKGCKDLNETFLRFKQRGVDEVFRRAQWCHVGGLYTMSELPPYAQKQCFSTGKDWLDPHYRIRMGDFCVITGRPGDGKSTFVNDIMCSAVERHGWKVAFASFEQHPQADHRRALREWFCGAPVNIIAAHERDKADEWIDQHFVFIVPDWEDLADLKWTLERCAVAVVQHDCNVIVIDPWNELDHDKPRDVSITQYTGDAIKQFKRMATALNIHVIVVAHPTKLVGNEAPGLYSISDSAHWANKPDVGIVVYKPNPDTQYAEIMIKKSRYHDQIGKPGTINAEYMPLVRKFQRAVVTDEDDNKPTQEAAE